MAINPKAALPSAMLKDLRLLVVDDEDLLAWSIDNEMRALGADVQRAGSIREALERFAAAAPDVVITDLRLPDGNGLELVKKWRVEQPELPVILVTAHGAIDSAVTALRLGACDYLQKPFDMKDLIAAVARAGEIAKLRQKVGRLQGRDAAAADVAIIGETPPVVTLRNELLRIARSKANTALILGESGTGKELAARAIHEWGGRRGLPFVEINCASIPETLLESELFGYEKGAFTDARERKLGLFEIARNGSIFLDEIGELPLKLQAKLLRVLEHRRFKRLGGTKDIEFTGRIIAATNRDLLHEAAAKRFRADLYYRLCALPVYVPLLRERPADIPLLCEFFLEDLAHELELKRPLLSAAAVAMLQSHPWPGNVRELRNVLQRAMIFHEPETVEPRHLRLDVVPEGLIGPGSPSPRAEPSAQRPDADQAPAAAAVAISPVTLVGPSDRGVLTPPPAMAQATVPAAMPAPEAAAGAPEVVPQQPPAKPAGALQPPATACAFLLPLQGIDLEVLEKSLLEQALERARHNQTRAAQLLGITRHTLRYRLEKHGLIAPLAPSL